MSHGPTLQYDWAIDPEITDDCDDNKKSRIGVASLVRKLNCGKISSKEKRDSMNSHQQFGGLRQQGFEINAFDWHNEHMDEIWKSDQSPSCHPVSREVNITVEGGNMPQSDVELNRRTRQNPFAGFGAARRSIHVPLVDGRRGRNSLAQMMPIDDQSSLKYGIDPVGIRKERWLRLIQQGWGEENEEACVISGDDSTAHGSSRSRRGGSTDSYSGDTEYTTESDESAPSTRRRTVTGEYNVVHRSPARSRPLKPQRRVKQSTDSDLWTGFAEDVGIFAGLILADGGACIGTISDITHETVAESCNSTDTRERLMGETFYSIDSTALSMLEGE